MIDHWYKEGVLKPDEKIDKEKTYIENSMKKYGADKIIEIWNEIKNQGGDPDQFWYLIRGLGLEQKDFVGKFLEEHSIE